MSECELAGTVYTEEETVALCKTVMSGYLSEEWVLLVVDLLPARKKDKGLIDLIGHCSYDRKEISINRRYAHLWTKDYIYKLITHEIAHALTWPEEQGHGKIFNAKWKELYEKEIFGMNIST